MSTSTSLALRTWAICEARCALEPESTITLISGVKRVSSLSQL